MLNSDIVLLLNTVEELYLAVDEERAAAAAAAAENVRLRVQLEESDAAVKELRIRLNRVDPASTVRCGLCRRCGRAWGGGGVEAASLWAFCMCVFSPFARSFVGVVGLHLCHVLMLPLVVCLGNGSAAWCEGCW